MTDKTKLRAQVWFHLALLYARDEIKRYMKEKKVSFEKAINDLFVVHPEGGFTDEHIELFRRFFDIDDNNKNK